jgi:hypothetical protein
MSEFRSRFQHPYSRTPIREGDAREGDVKLRMSSGGYDRDPVQSPYITRQAENQKIKNLSFWDNGDQDGRDDTRDEGRDDEWQDRQSPVPFILIAVILVVASTVLWFVFKWATGDHSNVPPIIAADTAPFKVRPENPGGMMIPHQDKLVYGRLSQDTTQPVERLLPLPEQPMAAPHQMAPQPMAPQPMAPQQPGASPQMGMSGPHPSYPAQGQGYSSHPQGYSTSSMPDQGVQSQSQAAPHHPQSYFPPQQQTHGQEQVHHGQGQAQGQGQGQGQGQVQGQAPYHHQNPYQAQSAYPASSQPQPAYGGQQPSQPAGLPPVPQIPFKQPDPIQNSNSSSQLTSVEEIKPATDEEGEGANDTPDHDAVNTLDQLIAKEVGKPTKQPSKNAEGKTAKQMPLNPGKHKVQIASLPSRAMAEQEMKRLRKDHVAVFQNKPWNIQKINLGPDRGFTHRLVVGSFSNQEAAAKYCKKLRAEKIGCMVVAPVNE